MMKPHRFKHYLPSIFFFMLALLFYEFPQLAAFLLVGMFATLGLLYFFLIRKLHRFHDAQSQWSHPSQQGFVKEVYDSGEPNFKNVTVTVLKRGQVDRFFS